MSLTLNKSNFGNTYKNYVSVTIERKDEKGVIDFKEFSDMDCFGFMSYSLNDFRSKYTPINLYSALRMHSKGCAEFVNKYYDWIFDLKVSPWRDLLKGVEYETTDQSSTPYVKIPVSRDTPIQFLISLLIASRAGLDTPNSVRLFIKLKDEEKWDQYEAFYTSIYLGLDNKGRVTDGSNQDWWAFSAHHKNNFEWIKKGTPRINKSNVFGQSYGKIQAIWLDKDPNYAIAMPTAEFYSYLAESRKYDGSFEKVFKRQYGQMNFPLMNMPKYDELLKRREILFKEAI